MHSSLTPGKLAGLGRKLRQQRRLLDKKIETVAEALRVSKAVISRIENRRYPSLRYDMIVALCEHLRLKVEDVVKDE